MHICLIFGGHRTKRMVVDVLKVQPGDNLTEVLYTPATPEQVKRIVHVQDTLIATATQFSLGFLNWATNI